MILIGKPNHCKNCGSIHLKAVERVSVGRGPYNGQVRGRCLYCYYEADYPMVLSGLIREAFVDNEELSKP